jgi:hypothetical protein
VPLLRQEIEWSKYEVSLCISEYCPPSNRSKIEIQGIADNCNDRKTNSKRVQDLSAELYFSVFVKVRK